MLKYIQIVVIIYTTLVFLPPEVTIGFRPTDYSAVESQGTVDLIVEVISGTLGRHVEINFSTQSGTAIGIDQCVCVCVQLKAGSDH